MAKLKRPTKKSVEEASQVWSDPAVRSFCTHCGNDERMIDAIARKLDEVKAKARMKKKLTSWYEVYESTERGKPAWRWRLKGGNGEPICWGEAHRDERDAGRAVAGVRRNAATTVVKVVRK